MLNPKNLLTPREHVIDVALIVFTPYVIALFLLLVSQLIPLTPTNFNSPVFDFNFVQSVNLVMYCGLLVPALSLLALFVGVLRWRLIRGKNPLPVQVRRVSAILNTVWISMITLGIVIGFLASFVASVCLTSAAVSTVYCFVSFAVLIYCIFKMAPYFESLGRDYDDELQYRATLNRIKTDK